MSAQSQGAARVRWRSNVALALLGLAPLSPCLAVAAPSLDDFIDTEWQNPLGAGQPLIFKREDGEVRWGWIGLDGKYDSIYEVQSWDGRVMRMTAFKMRNASENLEATLDGTVLRVKFTVAEEFRDFSDEGGWASKCLNCPADFGTRSGGPSLNLLNLPEEVVAALIAAGTALLGIFFGVMAGGRNGRQMQVAGAAAVSGPADNEVQIIDLNKNPDMPRPWHGLSIVDLETNRAMSIKDWNRGSKFPPYRAQAPADPEPSDSGVQIVDLNENPDARAPWKGASIVDLSSNRMMSLSDWNRGKRFPPYTTQPPPDNGAPHSGIKVVNLTTGQAMPLNEYSGGKEFPPVPVTKLVENQTAHAMATLQNGIEAKSPEETEALEKVLEYLTDARTVYSKLSPDAREIANEMLMVRAGVPEAVAEQMYRKACDMSPGEFEAFIKSARSGLVP